MYIPYPSCSWILGSILDIIIVAGTLHWLVLSPCSGGHAVWSLCEGWEVSWVQSAHSPIIYI